MSDNNQFGVTQTDVFSCGLSVDTPRLNSSIENPATDLNDPHVWDLLTDSGSISSANVRVNETKSLSCPAIWQALELIGGDVAKLPLDLHRKDPSGDREKLSEDPLYELVRWQPNPEMNAYKFWSRMIAWRLLYNNAYAFIQRDGSGDPIALYPLLPDRTVVERHDRLLYCVTELDGKLVAIPMSEVFHLEGVGIDNLQGFRFVKAAREAIGLALAGVGFASKFFKNGGRVGGILELPSSMPKPSRDKVEEGFRKTYDDGESFKTVVLRDNAKFHTAQTSPKETQVIDSRRESVRDVARYMNVRPGKLGEESQVSYASKSEDNRDYLDTTLSHHLVAIVHESRSKLLSKRRIADGQYFEHNTRALLMMDPKNEAETISDYIAAEVMSPNEARERLNLNRRRDPGGDEYRNPNTKAADGNKKAASSARLLAVQTLERVAKTVARQAKLAAVDPNAFIAWVDRGMGDQADMVSNALHPVLEVLAEVEIPTFSAIDRSKEIARDLTGCFESELLRVAEESKPDGLVKSVEDVTVALIANASDYFKKNPEVE